MRLFLALAVFLGVTAAKADVIFSPAISYMKVTEQDHGNNTKSAETSAYDLRLGYLAPSGLYIGGMYSLYKDGDNKGFSGAATLGYYHYSGFTALFSYHLIGDMDRDASFTYKDGMGPQIDIGWNFPLTSSFSIGPQMTYRSLNYKKSDPDTPNVDFTRSMIYPYVSLWFRF